MFYSPKYEWTLRNRSEFSLTPVKSIPKKYLTTKRVNELDFQGGLTLREPNYIVV